MIRSSLRSAMLLLSLFSMTDAFSSVHPALAPRSTTVLRAADGALTRNLDEGGPMATAANSDLLVADSEESWLDYEEAWRASFSRNNFADFVPSDYDGAPDDDDVQQCLTLTGGASDLLLEGDDMSSNKPSSLPWDVQAENSHVAYLHQDEERPLNPDPEEEDFAPGFGGLQKVKIAYDVILDKGLLEDLIRICNEKGEGSISYGPVQTLFEQASAVIRENGIYVLMTSTPLSPEMQAYLQELGKSVGLEWNFTLDGISNPNMGVSVARKMCEQKDVGGDQTIRKHHGRRLMP